MLFAYCKEQYQMANVAYFASCILTLKYRHCFMYTVEEHTVQ